MQLPSALDDVTTPIIRAEERPDARDARRPSNCGRSSRARHLGQFADHRLLRQGLGLAVDARRSSRSTTPDSATARRCSTAACDAWTRDGNPVTDAVDARADRASSPTLHDASRSSSTRTTCARTSARHRRVRSSTDAPRSFYDGVQPGGGRDDAAQDGTRRRREERSLHRNRRRRKHARRPPISSQALFAKAGVQPSDTIVGYCHIGQQATACCSPRARSDIRCCCTTDRSTIGRGTRSSGRESAGQEQAVSVRARREPAPYSNPYLTGVGLGLVLLAAFVVMGRGLGASGAFASSAAGVVSAIVSPQRAQCERVVLRAT